MKIILTHIDFRSAFSGNLVLLEYIHLLRDVQSTVYFLLLSEGPNTGDVVSSERDMEVETSSEVEACSAAHTGIQGNQSSMTIIFQGIRFGERDHVFTI